MPVPSRGFLRKELGTRGGQGVDFLKKSTTLNYHFCASRTLVTLPLVFVSTSSVLLHINVFLISDHRGNMQQSKTGLDLIRDPLLNKGTAFTEAEREAYKLHGLLPPHIGTLEEQIERRWEMLQQLQDPLQKYIFLRELQDASETLFLALMCRYTEELMPIVYTPTVGEGCIKFSHIYRKPRGLVLSYPLRHRIDEILSNSTFDEVEVIVVTDGERILGLGDLGAGGMGIPIGKLALYAAGGGFRPQACLPIVLDVGTDNVDLLNDPLYIGWRNPRIRGEQYDEMVELFVKAVKSRWPGVLLQWEDFHKDNASRILERYRSQICSFNDDIQGTAVVTLGALIAAARLAVPGGKLSSLRFCFLGAGSAACGIADLLRAYMEEEGDYDPKTHYFTILNSKGLVTDTTKGIQSFQQPFVTPRAICDKWNVQDPERINLLEVVKNFKPTALIGVSTVPKAFTEEIVREMASYCERPIIFPLSNPSKKAEAHPQDIMTWTDYKALIATGSPFGTVKADEKGEKLSRVAQANNVYVFPGIGLGATAVQASQVSDRMLLAAAHALAGYAASAGLEHDALLPHLKDLRKISKVIANAVARKARDEGFCKKMTDAEIAATIMDHFWEPRFESYV